MTLRVLANASSARVGGGLSYIVQQLAALERARPELDLRVLAAPWNEVALTDALAAPVTCVRVPNAGARFAYEQVVLPLRMRPAEILYCPGNFGPLLPGGPPTVLTLQNPNYVGDGPAHPANRGRNRRAKIALSRRSMRRADRVVAISEALAADVRRSLPELGGRLVVVRSGAPEWGGEAVAPPGFPLAGGHLVSLANDYPHKNLDQVVRAWATAMPGADDPALVMVGDIAADRVEAQRASVDAPQRRRLLHLGPVSDRPVVRWLLANAAAMVAPSALEAFPLTPAEAGSVGCPVILSDIAAHREVAGDDAEAYVAVGDDDALVAAIRAVVAAPPPRRRWTWDRSWDRNADELANVFEDLHTTGAA